MHRALAIVSLSIASACGETPSSPGRPNIAAAVRHVASTFEPIIMTGSPNEWGLAGDGGHIGFSTQGTSTWDDIRITHGTTVITETFDDGTWDTTAFELADALRPGAVIDGAYRSTGVPVEGEPYAGPDGGALRTKAQFVPTASVPLVIEATFRQGASSFSYFPNLVMWRNNGSALPSPPRGAFFVIQDDLTGLFNFADVAPVPIPEGFIAAPVTVRIVDDGTTTTLTVSRGPGAR